MSAPTLVSIAAKDRTIAIKYSQPLDETSAPLISEITIGSSNPSSTLTTTSVNVLGDTIYVGVAELMLVALISVTTNSEAIKNLAGEVAANFNSQLAVNTSNGTDSTAPALLANGIVADEEFVYLYFNEVLSINSVPAGSAFTVLAAYAAQPSIFADLVEVYGIKVTLTLEGWIRNNQGLTAAYAVPASNAIKDVAGNAAAAIAATAATVKTSRLAIANYLSVYAADQIASQIPAAEVAYYTAATAADRRRWLRFASRDVNNAMKYQGRKFDPLSSFEFPRISDAGSVSLPYTVNPSIAPFAGYWPGGVGVAGGTGVETWDYDLENNRAVVPMDVKLAVVRQANALAAGRGNTLAPLHDGLQSQQVGSLQESYFAGAAPQKLCLEAWELLKRYELRTGSML
jgi:hypothetical protein